MSGICLSGISSGGPGAGSLAPSPEDGALGFGPVGVTLGPSPGES